MAQSLPGGPPWDATMSVSREAISVQGREAREHLDESSVQAVLCLPLRTSVQGGGGRF
jgi:hypothetical protein